jgi:hypothetical protein
LPLARKGINSGYEIILFKLIAKFNRKTGMYGRKEWIVRVNGKFHFCIIYHIPNIVLKIKNKRALILTSNLSVFKEKK